MTFNIHANRGRAWEDRLAAWHHAYAREGHAEVMRLTPPTKRLKGGAITAVGVGDCDFGGVALGVPVLFDAKACRLDRWDFGNLVKRPKQKSGQRQIQMPSIHQPLQLDRWVKADGCAFIALQMGERGFVVPWVVEGLAGLWWSWWHAKKRKQTAQASIDLAWCQEWAWSIPMRSGWLQYVREWTARRAVEAL